MRITCYATTEGLNENGCYLPRDVLLKKYQTLKDKPVFIVPDRVNHPTGHGYDYKNGRFKTKERIAIGHVVEVEPVIVDDAGAECSLEDLGSDFVGQLRVKTWIVISKEYYGKIAEVLETLHVLGKLFFSIESFTNCIVDEESKIRTCTDIDFIGLCVVANPAFKNAKSITVSEEETILMEKEYETLLTEKVRLESKTSVLETTLASKEAELETLNGTLATVKQELETTKAELASKASLETELASVKQKLEQVEKEKIGKERLEKLSKFGETKETIETLAGKTDAEFTEMVIAAVESFDPEKDKTIVAPFFKTGTKKSSPIETLKSFLEGDEE